MPHVVADTDALRRDGVISAETAREIEARRREVMVHLAINAVFCFGVPTPTRELIFWLAAPLPVVVVGGLAKAVFMLHAWGCSPAPAF